MISEGGELQLITAILVCLLHFDEFSSAIGFAAAREVKRGTGKGRRERRRERGRERGREGGREGGRER